MARALGGLVALLLLAAPGQAQELGSTGLDVVAGPGSLLIRAIAPYSPAAQARVPVGARLAFVNGEDAMGLYQAGRLEAALATASVLLAVGVRGPLELQERLLGPYELVLMASPVQRAFSALDEGDWATARDLALSPMLEATASERVWVRLALEARSLAAAGQWRSALGLAELLPAETVTRSGLAPELARWQVELASQQRDDRALLPREKFRRGPGPVLRPPTPRRPER